MTNWQLISKIKKLRKIKPRKDWVVLLKERLLEEEDTSLVFDWNLILKPIFVFSVIGIMITAGIVFISLTKPSQDNISVNSQTENLNVALKNLGNELAKTNAIIKELNGTSTNIMKNVASTVEKGKIVVNEAKKYPILASITDEVDYNLNEMAKETAKQAIESLKKSILNENQTVLLKEAEEYYNKGEYENALNEAIEASQTK